MNQRHAYFWKKADPRESILYWVGKKQCQSSEAEDAGLGLLPGGHPGPGSFCLCGSTFFSDKYRVRVAPPSLHCCQEQMNEYKGLCMQVERTQ